MSSIAEHMSREKMEKLKHWRSVWGESPVALLTRSLVLLSLHHHLALYASVEDAGDTTVLPSGHYVYCASRHRGDKALGG